MQGLPLQTKDQVHSEVNIYRGKDRYKSNCNLKDKGIVLMKTTHLKISGSPIKSLKLPVTY